MGQSKISYKIIIDERLAGRTLKSILQSELKLSTRLLRNDSARKLVTRNGEFTYLNQRANLGDVINIMLPNETSELTPEPMSIDIRYEDDEVLVVNKPAGILVHPTAKERGGSLLSGVAHLLQPLGFVPHAVHRLDRGTSGLVMFAKHAHTHHLYDLTLRAGGLHRTYCAIVDHSNAFEVPSDGEWTTIDLPIAQDEHSPSRRVISASGQRAITHYRILANRANVSLVQIVLETGRTHQIRLHFSAVGMPLLGDPVYGRKLKQNHGILEPEGIGRQALHACQLSWRHPVLKELHEVAADVPDDMRNVWTELGGSGDVWASLMSENPSLRLVKPV